MNLDSPAVRAFRAGRYGEVAALVERGGRAAPAEAVLYVESLDLLGYSLHAEREARRLLQVDHLSPALASRCTAVLADQNWYGGDLGGGLELSHRALALAETDNDLAQTCRATAHLLERTCDSTGFDSSLPLSTRTRRSAAKCADPQISALVHSTFGRLEAKVGHFDTASRHFSMARSLLQEEMNIHLLATVELGEATVASILGDLRGAIELAQRGAALAAQAGWSRGKVAAAANLAHFYVTLGEMSLAEEQLKAATVERFSSPSYEVALADTRARLAAADGDYRRAIAILDEGTVAASRLQRWYELAAEETRSRLLLRLDDRRQVLERTKRAIAVAESARLRPTMHSFKIIYSEAQLQAGHANEIDIPLLESHSDWPLPLVGEFHALLGRALSLTASGRRSVLQTSRAVRVLEGASHISAARELSQQVRQPSSLSADKRNSAARADLDSAVAILELAGHPHILAREAFALLQETDCAEQAALLAGTGPTLRVIDTHRWTADEALAAARAAAPSDLITAGMHRQEPWQILTRPRPDLDHRCTLAAIRKLVDTAATLDRYRRDEKQRAALWPAEALDGDPESLWASEQSAELLTIGRRIAAAPLPILLTGETGTGKEMLARAIHRASDRADRPMVPFNCTAVPRDMLESQLFGYRKGAFTGADASFPGVIRAAAGGTLFLDEIGDMGLDVQPKILRFLENQEIHPLGEPHPVKVDVRVIAATNGNLDELVAQGRFREDLFYRLNVVRLNLPPLRERREEIPPLVQHYIRRHGDELRKGRLTLSDETLEYLLLYSWPGNIRQLANEVRRMVALAEVDSTLTPALLSPEIQASRRTIPATPDAGAEIRVRLDQPLPAAIDFLEQIMVRRALEQTKGRVEEASRVLGISRKGLFLKRRRMGLRQLT